ncbi:MAG: galactose-1-phosphate uridylyltransferase [Pseudonocardiaceae bacterium]|nr:galactose-1-phosphate uridylyltransferase [Pseudonocardiaceae bacterium]
MCRTSTTLSDGRELIYFDDTEPYSSGGVTRECHDARDLATVRPGGVRRLDPLTGEWVTIAAHRMDRTHLPAAESCPLCPTRPGRRTEIPADDYDVVAFENRFPSFTGDTGDTEPVPTTVDGTDLWPQAPATGRCEVVCFTSDHDASFTALGPARVRTVIEAWADRTAALSQLDGVAQVFCFENRGEEIGVTLHHPHGQIYGYPFVTPRTAQLLRRAAAHHGDLLGDVLAAERRAASRLVVDGEHWTAFVPAAARWPVEVHLVPHRPVPDLAALHDAERDELAVRYPDLLRRVEIFFAEAGDTRPVPYIAAWQQAPVGTGRELTRLYLQLFSVRRAPGTLKYLAGSESAAGAWINDAVPEQIAQRLRDAAT